MKKLYTSTAATTCSNFYSSFLRMPAMRILLILVLMVGVKSVGWGQVVISQVYGGGGNQQGTPYQNDFVELFNRGSVGQNLNGWSIQYATSSGISWAVTSLPNVTLNPGQYFLIQLGPVGTFGVALPSPDLYGSTGININANSGKIALCNSSAALTGKCPTGGSIKDFVGYGSANCFEGSLAAPKPLNDNTAVIRISNGCTDVGNNSIDFITGDPTPRNNASPVNICASNPFAYFVTGGGEECSGGPGFSVGISGSELGVSYQLYNDLTAIGSPVNGTGSSLTWGPFTVEGTYTVKGTNNNGTTDMLDNAVITILPPVTPSFTPLGPYCIGSTPGDLPTTSQGGDGLTGTWSPPTINTLVAGTTTYTFTTLEGQIDCQTAEVTMDVIVVARPTANAGPDGTPGIGIPYQMNGTATNYASVSWARYGGGSGDGNLSSTTILNPVFTGSAIGPITYRLTVAGEYCTATDDITLNVVGTESLIWNGSLSSDWHEAANWTPEIVPSSTQIVSIPVVSTYPTISAAAACKNITIASGASLIDNGYLVLTDPNGLTVNHPAITAGQWHFISSPVSGVVSNFFIGNFLYDFSTSTNTYTPITATNVSLAAMKGYGLYPKTNAFTVPFVGGLNPSSNSFAISAASEGWNLIGNPYTSAINWDAVDKTGSGADGAIYIYNGVAWGTYIGGAATGNGSKFIAPIQGFFVRASGSGTLHLTDADRVHNSVSFSKNSNEVVPNLLRLLVSGNGYKDDAVVRFVPEATAEFDGKYDAYKRFGDVAEAAQVYTLGSIPLAINSLPEIAVIPVGIKIGAEGSYTIASTEMNDIPSATLEDTETGIFTDLSDSPYTFTALTGTFDKRFILHFSLLSIAEPISKDAIIYSYQKTVHINLKDQVKGDIFIYNITGQLVATRISAQGTNEIKLPNTGNYIVKVVSRNNTMVRKVFIQ